MDYIINHKRFKKKYSFNELDKYLWSEKRISKFPHSIKGYFDFFNGYAKKNYTLIPTKCLCDNNDDILLSKSDRHCVEFPTVVCKKCDLIRAWRIVLIFKKYFSSFSWYPSSKIEMPLTYKSTRRFIELVYIEAVHTHGIKLKIFIKRLVSDI